ncbi:solanesyl diphosphate synthase [bacterium (Candidatus Blackallbacteria) CG17_big_fil_post_rev_8_21_14_2_50_48_46]|uniref:Solanesyl diphosphate synthase n=1 Tax=bacterium (Candidatus Blackallbacteria) CG17_big_fil_post_rev_8_21_14_2_50_48_46 TaxID=2014261 RepID=A0A2M7G8F1_9BACT|nr:MAG: solanesyl diphosphate synthase [bacterium (Candidatus Blackallbacteria) CG18_big_fil_WC_8_21_14_2_50_49_26]PIW18387.1 MAG: solanesyl diphosphate synthase [bacterium (Candidatus Blackallbacteria) CG17_big_fil_post_rev_8_21_14_2_50_48_46]PIW50546.1 MAG: solanesyl diphosphate synthase [bacterium (Candidatus Blackallbacteria) CG13_big_fil_rev_8_21_14_2_50_49_14]
MKSAIQQHSFFKLLEKDLNSLESIMISELQVYDPTLIAAATHLMKAGGKRLRPVMALLCAKATLNQEVELERPHYLLAMALEILHTATLIHDDIIDASNLRRGLPTVNQQWGNRTSVLAGDFLLARSCYYVSIIASVELNTIFSQMVMDMCNGELSQFQRRFKSTISLAEYLEQISSKTALLMAVGCQGAGIINGADEAIQKALYQYGHQVGLAFQIMDDILDFTVSERETGKSVFNDLAQGQITLPTWFALQESEHAEELQRLIDTRFVDDEDLQRAIEIVVESKALDSCHKLAQEYVDEAVSALALLPESPARQALEELAAFSVQRKQ